MRTVKRVRAPSVELHVSPPFLAGPQRLSFPPLRAFLQTRKAQLFWAFPKWAPRRFYARMHVHAHKHGPEKSTGKERGPPAGNSFNLNAEMSTPGWLERATFEPGRRLEAARPFFCAQTSPQLPAAPSRTSTLEKDWERAEKRETRRQTPERVSAGESSAYLQALQRTARDLCGNERLWTHPALNHTNTRLCFPSLASHTKPHPYSFQKCPPQ